MESSPPAYTGYSYTRASNPAISDCSIKRKEYIPCTIRTFTLLVFILLCLGFLGVVEAILRLVPKEEASLSELKRDLRGTFQTGAFDRPEGGGGGGGGGRWGLEQPHLRDSIAIITTENSDRFTSIIQPRAPQLTPTPTMHSTAAGSVYGHGFVVRASVTTANKGVPTLMAPPPSLYNDGFIRLEVTTTANYNYYLVGQYLLTLIAVLLGMLWKIIDTDFKRIEPFYLLSDPNGSWQPSLLCENLLFSNLYVAPFEAAYRNQWIPCFAGFITGPVFTVVQLLSPVVVVLTTQQECSGFAKERTCGLTLLRSRPSLGRILEAVLAVLVVLILWIITLQRKRKTQLRAEPWSLAGLAVLVADWPALDPIFGTIDAGDSSKQLKRKLIASGRHYRLSERLHPTQKTPHMGLEALSDNSPWPTAETYQPHVQISRNQSRPRVARPFFLRSFILLFFMLILCGVLGMVLLYRFVRIVPYEKFMSGQGVGAKVLMVGIGIVIRGLWEPIEKEVRHLEVFYKLSQRHEKAADTLFTDYVRGVPLMTELQALYRGDFFMAFIGIVGIAIEALVVVLPGIPFTPTQTWNDFNISTGISVAVLSLTILAIIAAFFRRRRLCIPRLPYNIATLIAYMYAARMLDSFVGLSLLGTRERNKKIKALGRVYGFGWTTGRDGRHRVGIDEEELDYSYKFSS